MQRTFHRCLRPHIREAHEMQESSHLTRLAGVCAAALAENSRPSRGAKTAGCASGRERSQGGPRLRRRQGPTRCGCPPLRGGRGLLLGRAARRGGGDGGGRGLLLGRAARRGGGDGGEEARPGEGQRDGSLAERAAGGALEPRQQAAGVEGVLARQPQHLPSGGTNSADSVQCGGWVGDLVRRRARRSWWARAKSWAMAVMGHSSDGRAG